MGEAIQGDNANAEGSSQVARGGSSDVLRELKSIDNKLGATYQGDSLLGRVDQAVKNTYETCKDATSTSFCKY